MKSYLAYDEQIKGKRPGVLVVPEVWGLRADKLVTPEQVKAFKQEMKSAGADFRFISYPGAMHSFTNPEATELGKKFNLSIAYNADADKKSWGEMTDFLKKIFEV
jgi:dienelactone hydrolase